jgi:hypothetical protein
MKDLFRVSLSAAAASLSLAASSPVSATPPSIRVDVHHAEERSGTVTLEVAGAPPCVIVLKGDGKSREACTIPVPAGVNAIRLSGEVRWKHWTKGRQVSKGTQSWKVLDLGPVVAPLRDASRPIGARMKGLVAALPAFEKASGGLVEESTYLVDAGEKGTAAAVAAAEKRLGYALPPDYASLVVDFGVPQLGDSYFERPEKLASAFEQMVKQWGTPRADLEKALSGKTKALYRSGTLLYTEVGDGLGGLLYQPAPVPECGGKAATASTRTTSTPRASQGSGRLLQDLPAIGALGPLGAALPDLRRHRGRGSRRRPERPGTVSPHPSPRRGDDGTRLPAAAGRATIRVEAERSAAD